jgi:hypothetical protein
MWYNIYDNPRGGAIYYERKGNMKTIGEQMGAQRKLKIQIENTPYNEKRRKHLLAKSRQGDLQRQKDKQDKSYRKLFTKLTGEAYTGHHDTFLALEDQFGLRAVQEAVEYMAVKGQDWNVPGFMSYILKVLQSGRDELESSIDSSTERQREAGERLLREAKAWRVLKGMDL